MSEGPYEIEPQVRAPALPGHVTARRTVEDALDALTADFVVHSINCARAFGSFHIALSGGSTPLPFYQRLMIDPDCRAIPWERAHLWIVDERRAPFDDARSNFGQIRDILVAHSDIPAANVHPIHPMEPDADTAYERELVTHLGARGPGKDRLDFVLLGMGADAHTASLFPRSPALAEMRRLIRINSGPTVVPPDRVTMTLPLLNASRFIAVLVTGEGKRETIARVSEAFCSTGAPGAEITELRTQDSARVDLDLPIVNIKPLAGELRWYLDAAACP